MKLSRHYTTPNQSPYAEIEFRLSKSEIRNPDGSMVFSSMKLRFLWIGARSRQISSPKNISEEPGFQPV